MSATATEIGGPVRKVPTVGASPLRVRVRARLQRRRLDRELASGTDPNTDPARRERARELVGEKTRRQIAACLERLLAEADSAPRGAYTSRMPIARTAIRDSRLDLETIVERLKAPAYISSRGVAMISLLCSDGAGPLYGNNPAHSQELRRALAAVVEAIDHGPVLVG